MAGDRRALTCVRRRVATALAALIVEAAIGAACTLNPQPLPPVENDHSGDSGGLGNNGQGSADATPATGNNFGTGDAGPPREDAGPFSDGGASGFGEAGGGDASGAEPVEAEASDAEASDAQVSDAEISDAPSRDGAPEPDGGSKDAEGTDAHPSGGGADGAVGWGDGEAARTGDAGNSVGVNPDGGAGYARRDAIGFDAPRESASAGQP